MKRALIVPLLLLFCITSFTSKTDYLTIEDALTQKKITLGINFKFDGDYRDISLHIKNISGGQIKLRLDPGTLFFPGDTNEQTLVNTEEQYVEVGKDQSKVVNSMGFCTEYDDHGSDENSTFTIGHTSNAKLLKLVNYLDSTKVADQDAMQHAVWCITNDHNISNVFLDDTASSHSLQTLLCKLTGKQSTWYTSEEKIVRDEENNFVLVPTEVKGQLSFHTDDVVEIQGMITDDSGKVLYKNQNKSTAGPGDVDFDFELSVQGWPKGTYHVVYMSNGKEMLNQAFTI